MPYYFAPAKEMVSSYLNRPKSRADGAYK